MPDRQYILTELQELDSQLPSEAPRQPYSVPNGYFEELPAQILNRIRQEESGQELKTLSPTLSQISRQNPYTIPHGYFERPVNGPIEQSSPVISLIQRRWVRYAVATAALLTGVFVWVGRNEPPPAIANKVIKEVEKDIQKMNEKEETLLQDFVMAGLTGQETAQTKIQTNNFSGLLADVSEQELNEFMEQSEFITATEKND